MKKSAIAIAIAAAMPITAQAADYTITGSVNGKYYVNDRATAHSRVGKALDIDADIDIAVTEVLANGLTASANFDVDTAGGKGGNTGTVSLSGESLGTIKLGAALQSDGAFQSGDVASAVDDATTTSSSSAVEANAIHYSNTWGGVNVQLQRNASTTATGEAGSVTADDGTKTYSFTQTASSQYGISYEVIDGLTVGYAATTGDLQASLTTDATAGRVFGETSVIGAKYVAGDLEVGFGQQADIVDVNGDKEEVDAKVTVKYTFGDMYAKMITANANDSKGDAQALIEFGYASDSISATVTSNAAKDLDTQDTLKLVLGYTSGNLVTTVTKDHDQGTNLNLAYNMGNATTAMNYDGSDEQATIEYKVSF